MSLLRIGSTGGTLLYQYKVHVLWLTLLCILFGQANILAQKFELGMTVLSAYADTSLPLSPVAKVFDIRKNAAAPRGEDWPQSNPKMVISPSTWTLQNMGEIYGIAIDTSGNIYMAATDMYKLDNPSSATTGSFSGPAGPGGLYLAASDDLSRVSTIIRSVDAPSIAELPSGVIPNTGGLGNGIGNVAYDWKNNQLFLTNLEDGRLYRIDLNRSKPAVVSIYDPFETDDAQRGMAPKREQLWAVGVYSDTSNNLTKVYYTTRPEPNVHGGKVFSITLDSTGEFIAPFHTQKQIYTDNGQLEITVPPGTSGRTRITDIAFSNDNRMLLAERGNPHRARVLEYQYRNDSWQSTNRNFNVGGWNIVLGLDGQNAAGGVDYGFRENGNNPFAYTDSLIWVSANYMSAPGAGSGFYYGIQGINARGNFPVTDPLKSNAYTDIFIDYDGVLNTYETTRLGDVEVYRDPSASILQGRINDILACNDLLQISLDSAGTVQVDIDMVTEGDGVNPCWQLRMFERGGGLIPNNILTCAYSGTTIDFLVKDTCTKISCWGMIKVEDKYPPRLYCANDTVRCGDDIRPEIMGFPIPVGATANATTDSTTFIVANWDSCGEVQLNYWDEIARDFDCDFDYKIILRHWTARDPSGNISTCSDSILVHLPNLIQDTIGLKDFYLTCDGMYPMLPNGYPSPELTGWPIPKDCTTLLARFEDTATPICGASEKILRKWTVLDWCAKGQNPKKLEFYQFIKIADDRAPVLYCDDNSDHVDTIGADYYLCSGTYTLPIPQNLMGINIPDSGGIYIISDCSDWQYRVKYIPAIGDLCQPNESAANYIGGYRTALDPPFVQSDLPVGCHWFLYEITDDCGNQSVCQIKMVVEDDLPPSVVCDAHTKVSLLGGGIVRVDAISFDDGTIDNCAIDSFAVRRMDRGVPCGNEIEEFADFVEFCCADIGNTVQVEFIAVDASGNSNRCMVDVVVEDKIRPRIVAPTDITIDCRFDYDINDLDTYFGKIADGELNVNEIFIPNDPHYDAADQWLAGYDGYAEDNCDEYFVTDTAIIDLNCGVGTIRRLFKVTDKGGLSSSAEQIISIKDSDPFNESDIFWPDDIVDDPIETDCVNGVTTDPSTTGEAKAKSNTGCANIAVNYIDKIFYGQDSACYKIIRKWTVLDWCQFKKSGDPIWEHDQIIKVANHNAPLFENGFCDDKVFCDSAAIEKDGLCQGYATLVGRATDDCTVENDLVWHYSLDRDNNGIWDTTIAGNDASGYYPVGTHRIRWEVTDLCGNISTCNFSFEVQDCKPPTPYCRNGIVTVVMPSSGQIEVRAEMLNIGSWDNCTDTANLVYSFTPDGQTPVLIYTCDSLGGQEYIEREVELWVLDEMGNKDRCSTIIKIQNNGTCASLIGAVSGNLLNFRNRPIEDVSMTLSSNDVALQTQKANGTYRFDNLKGNRNYTVKAKKRTNYDQNVSTRDLVLIQKHILAIKPFSAPWQFAAADANNSNSVSTADIAALRKIILGRWEVLPKQDSWVFYNRNVDLDDLNALYEPEDVYEINGVSGELKNRHFYGLKIGDVNGDLNGQFTDPMIEARGASDLTLVGMGESADDQLHVFITIPQETTLEGIQFTLNFDPNLLPVHVRGNALDIQPGNYATFEHDMTVVWSSAKARSLSAGDTLMEIVFEEASSSPSDDPVRLTSAITDALAFYPDNDEGTIDWRWKQRRAQSMSFVGIAPNPFYNETMIRFKLPESADVSLRIVNVQGKMVHSRTVSQQGGMVEIKIGESDILEPGIYWCEIQSRFGIIRKKIVLLGN